MTQEDSNQELRKLAYQALASSTAVADLHAVVSDLTKEIQALRSDMQEFPTREQLSEALDEARRESTSRRRYAISGIIVFIAIVALAGWWHNNERDEAFCLALNQNRAVLRDLVNQSSAALEPPPGASPELIEILKRSEERSEQFRREANDRLQPEPCGA